jgi:hypothetical protein
MEVINLGAGISASVYSLIKILGGKNPDGGIVYEIHDHLGPGSADPEFVNRTKEYYTAFIDNYLVDQWASNNISYVAKVDSTWFVAEHIGANTYVGTGPTSVIAMRKYCFEKRIKILYIEDALQDWLDETFGRKNITAPSKDCLTEIESYQKVNQIIQRCGDGIARIIKTAQKLIETNYRDHFLAAIHSHVDLIAEAEPLNRIGFTDLKIIPRNIDTTFVYEFKIFHNIKSVRDGLQQITDQYLTTQNKLNGLVFINTAKRDVFKIKQSIITVAESIGLQILPGTLDNPEPVITARHVLNRDSSIECTLTIFVFDIQQ